MNALPVETATSDFLNNSNSDSECSSPSVHRSLFTSSSLCFSSVGSHDYLSPEIILGCGHDYRADWWSLGVLTFELLTGTRPFHADTVEQIHDNIVERSFKWPDQPQISTKAKQFVESLLIIDVKQRLGANGCEEVQQHRFLKGIDWNEI